MSTLGDRRGVLHDLSTIRSLAIMVVVAECRSLTAILKNTPRPPLSDLRSPGLQAGQALPSESTIRGVKDLDPAGLDDHLTSWFYTRTGTLTGRTEIVARQQTMRTARADKGLGAALSVRPGARHRHGHRSRGWLASPTRVPCPAQPARPPQFDGAVTRRRRHAHPDRHSKVDHTT